ncbi:Uu.00g133790.m01.CDS01 [Anthostomella pinea]|uniref:Uu.00g133790.m01.CDS01 n=1 Tax=Anthostomella pinea TaxID=933095 RepID=A0AAI8VNW8_9PEZI|nr:Uu.00g133790.m01.CDS01 [Anthostomella pinea]
MERRSATTLSCKHRFCADCLREWLPRSSHGNCPICKRPQTYVCGHRIPDKQIKDGSEFTQAQIDINIDINIDTNIDISIDTSIDINIDISIDITIHINIDIMVIPDVRVRIAADVGS